MSGPDIFLSYNREDAARAKHFAEAFAAEGLDVWWDVSLRSGEAYDEVTERALGEAKAVIVLWSPRSVVSRWVRAEATEAERNKTLLPVMIEPCKRPIMFELVQTAELSHWRGDREDPAWQAFLGHVRGFIGKDAKGAAPAAPVAKPGQASVVVLPFANMSNDPEQEYFADGISEDIITDLSKVSALLVIARNTAFTFRGKHVDIKDVARQLEVTHVLEGSVRKAGNRLRITAQLIDGATGGHVWAERYDRELADIFDIQDEISEAIVGALKVRLLPAEKKAIEKRETTSAEAYDYYIRARALRAMGGMENMAQAIAAYHEAIALDPEFAAAWAGLASAQVINPWFTSTLGGADPDERHAALDRAMALAPDSTDVIAARSFFCLYDYGWDEMEACLAFWESQPEPKWTVHGSMLHALGRPNLASERQKFVCRSDPLSVGASFVFQHMLDCAGRLEEAEAEYQRVRHLPFGNRELHLRSIMRLYAFGEKAEAHRRFADDFGKDANLLPFAPALAKCFDQPEEACKVLGAALANPACAAPAVSSMIALWAGHFGDADIALDTFRSYAVDRKGLIGDIWNPAFIGFRSDPRFKQILIDVGLADHWRKTGKWGDFVRPRGDDDFEVMSP